MSEPQDNIPDPLGEFFESQGINMVDCTPRSPNISTKPENVNTSLEHVKAINTSPTESTEKTLFPRCEVCGKSHFEIVCYGTPEFEDRIRKFIENIHTGHYDYDEWYDTQVCDLMDIIASSNHQAVQAFGEKVLKEAVGEDEQTEYGSVIKNIANEKTDKIVRNVFRAKIRSVITSLLKGEKL